MRLERIDIFRVLGYVFTYAVTIAVMLSLFPPKDGWGYATLFAILLSPLPIWIVSMNRIFFHLKLKNMYIEASWLSLALLLFLFTAWSIYMDAGELLYVVFIVVAVATIGLLNIDKPKNILLQEEPKSTLAFLRGVIYGAIAFFFAILTAVGIIPSSIGIGSIKQHLIVGPVSTQLYDVFGLGYEYLLMLFIVAVPEELMGRVFYMRFGASVIDVFTASILTAVSGYAMHGITRYGLDYGSQVLFIITVVWILFTIAYVRHGLLCSISAHATYNTLITALEYGAIPYALSILIIGIIIGYMWKKKVVLL